MALISCPECNGNVSDTAEFCPHCGYRLSIKDKNVTTLTPEQEESIQKKHESYAKWFMIVMIVVILYIGMYPVLKSVGSVSSGVNVNFSSKVRNDTTGKLRIATTSSGRDPFYYAVDYYNKYFKSDDEIHAIWDATRGTTTRLSVSYGRLYVTTFKYVSGEEHDAKLLFSGKLQSERIIDISTGYEIKD